MNVSATRHDDATPWATLLAAGLIVLATAAAFSDSFAGPLIFDDEAGDLGKPEHPPALAASGRHSVRRTTARRSPAARCLNFSLAVNYAIERPERAGLPRDEPGHSPRGGLAAVRSAAADSAAAGDARRLGRGRHPAGPGRRTCSGPCIPCKPSP